MAASVLGKIGPDTKDALPALAGLLKDKHEDVRWAALDALGKIGPEAKAAIPVLVELLKDKEAHAEVR